MTGKVAGAYRSWLELWLEQHKYCRTKRKVKASTISKTDWRGERVRTRLEVLHYSHDIDVLRLM